MTTWRTIPSFPSYEISEDGVVRQTRTGRGCQAGAIKAPQNGWNYTAVCLYRDGKAFRRTIHQLLCEAFHGPRPPGAQARHLNDDRQDNRADNVAWGTHAENMADRTANGKTPRGEAIGNSKLTEKQVRQIRADRAPGRMTRIEVAAKYGIARQTVSRITTRRAWAHIKDDT